MNFIVNKYQGNVKLLLIACDEDEQNFLESHIGEVVELHAAQQLRAPDASLGVWLHCITCGQWHLEKESCIPANRERR